MSTATLSRPPVAPGAPRRSELADFYRRQASSRNLRADMLEVFGWATMAMSVALYLTYGGLADFTSIGRAFVGVGIIAGLTATNAMLLMLLLAARVDVIDRTLGQPRATALHSKLGDWVVIGLGIHGAFLVTGYALGDGLSVIDEFGSLWNGSTDFVLAILGMGLLLAVVFSSIVAARKKLSYEVWHAIHLLSYVAIGVSIPHMFSMGGLFGANTWQRWYWIGALVLTGAALLVYRVLMPLLSSFDHRVRVSRVTEVGPDTYNIEMTGRHLDDLELRAGQYLHWRFLAPGLWWHQHPFSVSAAPTHDSLRVTVRVLGKGTAALRHVRPGTMVGIEGPYGTFSDEARTKEGVALIGAGVTALCADPSVDREGRANAEKVLRAVGSTVDIAQEVARPFAFVVTQAKPNARLTVQAVAALSAHGAVAPAIVHDRVDYAASMVDGRTVQETDPKGRSAGEIIACLLYTSPSPRDGLLSRMPSSA